MSATEIADLLPADHIRPARRGALQRVLIPVLMVLVMVGASVGISSWSYLSHRAESLRLAEDLIASIEDRIQAQVHTYLAPLAELARLSVRVLGTEALTVSGNSATESFAMGVLNGNPQVAIASFGDADGNFLMYVRQPGSRIDTKRIERRLEGTRTSWIRRAADGTVVSEERVENDGYDPRERPWYRGASGGELYWSGVYRFFTSKQPGVTVSVPVRGADGSVAAVYGLDVTLANLSAFLAGLDLGEAGVAVIINGDGELIAYPPRATRAATDAQEVRSIADLADPALLRGFDRFRVEGPGRRVLSIQARRHLSTVSSLSELVGRDWWVMITVPEDQFTGTVRRNYRSQLLISAGVLLLAALLAWRVITQGLQALRESNRVAERDVMVNRRGAALADLSDCAARLEEPDEAALAELTETVSSALDAERVCVWRADEAELRCEETFDRRAGNHTRGQHLRRGSVPRLSALLDAPLAIADVAADARLESAEREHLARAGVGSLVSVPLGAHRLLWVEGPARSDAWARDALRFLQAAATALRPQRMASGTVAPRSLAPGGAPTPVALESRQRHALRVSALDPIRVRSLRERVRGGQTEVFGAVSVLVMVLDDAALWGAEDPGRDDRSLLDTLVREIQASADRHGIEYVKLLGARIVCATGFDDDTGQSGARAIAALALQLDSHCGQALTAMNHRLSFRIGIDTAAALGAGVGGDDWIFNLWGDAVAGALSMAESATPGSIQATEACYRLLHTEQVFSPRGRFYMDERGETTTYLLLGTP